MVVSREPAVIGRVVVPLRELVTVLLFLAIVGRLVFRIVTASKVRRRMLTPVLAVAALPTILIAQTSANFFFGGTSILIVVGVALDTVKQLEAQLMMRNYEGFMK